MNTPRRDTPDLEILAALFYPSLADLGRFEEVRLSEMPEEYRTLLAHTHHMTVAVERQHQALVDVEVIETSLAGDLYARKIILHRQDNGQPVQFGIMRVNFAYLDAEVRRKIESQELPLGRILIHHNVLREIFLYALWKVTPGDDLCRLLGLAEPATTYGRSAMIECNGEPAIELLEIVAPV